MNSIGELYFPEMYSAAQRVLSVRQAFWLFSIFFWQFYLLICTLPLTCTPTITTTTHTTAAPKHRNILSCQAHSPSPHHTRFTQPNPGTAFYTNETWNMFGNSKIAWCTFILFCFIKFFLRVRILN